MRYYNEVFDGQGNLVERVEVDVPDTRPSVEHHTDDGQLLTTAKQWESKKGWVTFRLIGDPNDCVYVSCPEASAWNEKCTGFPVTPAPAGSTVEEVKAHAADEVVRLTAAVGALEPQYDETGALVKPAQCPTHNPTTAAPTQLDADLSNVTLEDIAAAIARAIAA